MVSIKKMASAKKNAPSLDLKRATSKTWSRTLEPDPKKHESRKNRIILGLKNMSGFREWNVVAALSQLKLFLILLLR